MDRNQNTEEADESTGHQPVFANGSRKGTGCVAALCDLILFPGITVSELNWMEDTRLVFIGESAGRWAALCVMREAHHCLARWTWAGLEDSATGPPPSAAAWETTLDLQHVVYWSGKIGLEFPLSHWENRGSLNPFCEYDVAGGFLIESRDIPLFCPLSAIQICLPICRTGHSPIEKAAWSRHLRKQCKVCLVSRLTQHSISWLLSFLLSWVSITLQ